ncbi:hypothetical protein EBE87_20285 [Pseudoroseomonas wenyumeiae]|uniref:Uncharacterized protein n=1 Tax=Teichococcus wenyumeiae TaxID=2478470 RepID=A0A3A9JE46_9PROT|nr:hypothetical protein [Pseudoroseomonas wenyumeiae]RKK04822.1 hypothetical protein D6Z83_07560 [Pseudoroseomonas wenyumeiae]RMI19490.1 hypothetical protein EBE87_20285 [Pseudoroseomonas wenyumeiae]
MRAIQRLAATRTTPEDPPPLVDLDFSQGPLPAGATFTRAGGHESYFDGQGSLGVVSASNVPAFDHYYDAASGAWLPAGIPIRPSRRNQLANPRAVFEPGAAAPTGWDLSSGLNLAASATLAPASEGGMSGIDITLAGRTSGNTSSRYYISILFDKAPYRDDSDPENADTSTPGAGRGVGLGQPLSVLMHPRLLSGSLAAVVACEAFVRVYDATDTQLAITSVPFTPKDTPAASQEASATRTMPTTATYAYARPGLRLTVAGASDLNTVLRVVGVEAQVATSVVGLIPAGVEVLREGGSLSVDLPPGTYDLLVEDTIATWQDAITITTGSLLLEPRAGETHIRRVRVWPAGALSEPTKRSFIVGDIPDPTYVISADKGLVLDEAGGVVEWQVATGVRAYQPDAVLRPKVVQDEQGAGVQFDGTAYLLFDLPRSYGNEMSVAAVFSSASDSLRQTILGMGNTNNGYQLEINGQRPRTAATLIYGSYVSVSEVGPSWQDGAVLVYSRRGSDLHTYGVNGRQNIGTATALTSAYSGNGQKYIGCRAPGEQPFVGILREIQLYLDRALTQDQERLRDRELRGKWRCGADAKGCWNVTAGGQSSTGFVVAADVTQAAQRVALLVTDDPARKARIREIDPRPTTPLRRDNTRQYHQYKTEVTGLKPSTRYWYTLRIDGQVDASSWQSVMTMPVERQPCPYVKVLVGSCWSVPASLRMPIADAMAAEEAQTFFQIGDNAYPNHATTDLGIIRERTHRKVVSSPNAQTLLANTGMVWTPDNHDWAGSNPDWAEVVKGVPTKDVFAASRRVFREGFPHHPLVQETLGETDPEKLIVAQAPATGRVLWLVPDCISQRRYRDVPAAQATIMGHQTGHEFWDQLSWFLGRLATAKADGYGQVVFISPNRWSANNFPAYSLTYRAEYLKIIEGIKACEVPVLLVVGDIHMCAFDDGTNKGTSAPRSDDTLCIPQIVASPLHNGTLGNSPNSGVYVWRGVESKIRATRSYDRLEFEDSGSEIHWTATCLTQDSVTGLTTEAQKVSSRDGTVGVKLEAADLLVTEGASLSIPLVKTWFGKACSVDWATSAGASGKVSFRVNEGRVFASFPAGAEAGMTLTLSNPVGCELASPSVATIGVLSAKTSFAIDAMTVKPNREWTLAYDEWVRAMVAADAWNGLICLLATHDQQAAMINWTNPGVGALTAVNSPTWVAGRGWRSAGSAYLNAGIAYNAIPGMQQNDGHLGLHVVDDDGTGSGPLISTSDGATGPTYSYIDPKTAAGAFGSRMNTASNVGSDDSVQVASANGSALTSRISATSFDRYKDGVSIGPRTRASSPLLTGNLRLLRAYSQISAGRTLALATAGWHRDATQAAAFHAAVTTFLNRIAGITT